MVPMVESLANSIVIDLNNATTPFFFMPGENTEKKEAGKPSQCA